MTTKAEKVKKHYWLEQQGETVSNLPGCPLCIRERRPKMKLNMDCSVKSNVSEKLDRVSIDFHIRLHSTIGEALKFDSPRDWVLAFMPGWTEVLEKTADEYGDGFTSLEGKLQREDYGRLLEELVEELKNGPWEEDDDEEPGIGQCNCVICRGRRGELDGEPVDSVVSTDPNDVFADEKENPDTEVDLGWLDKFDA